MDTRNSCCCYTCDCTRCILVVYSTEKLRLHVNRMYAFVCAFTPERYETVREHTGVDKLLVGTRGQIMLGEIKN